MSPLPGAGGRRHRRAQLRPDRRRSTRPPATRACSSPPAPRTPASASSSRTTGWSFDYNAFGGHPIVGLRRDVPDGAIAAPASVRRTGGADGHGRADHRRSRRAGRADLPLFMTVISSVGPSVGYDHGSPVQHALPRRRSRSRATLHRVDIDADPDGQAPRAGGHRRRRAPDGVGPPMTDVTQDDARCGRRAHHRVATATATSCSTPSSSCSPRTTSRRTRRTSRRAPGVSLRSVYRYFEDLDALDARRRSSARGTGRAAPRTSPTSARARSTTGSRGSSMWRIRLYEAAAPTARAAALRIPVNPLLSEQMERVPAAAPARRPRRCSLGARAMSTAQRRAALAAVDTLLQFESAEHLRVRLGYSPAAGQRHPPPRPHRPPHPLTPPNPTRFGAIYRAHRPCKWRQNPSRGRVLGVGQAQPPA